jgi:hypothetical protein
MDEFYKDADISKAVADAPFLRQICVGADKGYASLNSGAHFRLVVTASGEKEASKHGRQRGDVTFSNKIARGRAVVERVFAHLKHRHGILALYECPATLVDGAFLDKLVLIAATLLNRKIDRRELNI